MKLNSSSFLASVLLSFLSTTIFAHGKTMIFKNQRGSILELKELPNHKIEGYFTTAVASKTCPKAIHQKEPLTGYLLGNALSFSVGYPMCHSVVSIIGNFNKQETSIDTLSILNKQSSDIEHEGPGSRMIGHDVYTKID